MNKYYERQYDAQHGGTGAIGAAAAEEKRLVAQMPTPSTASCVLRRTLLATGTISSLRSPRGLPARAPAPRGRRRPSRHMHLTSLPTRTWRCRTARPSTYSRFPTPAPRPKWRFCLRARGLATCHSCRAPRMDRLCFRTDGKFRWRSLTIATTDELEHARLAVHAGVWRNLRAGRVRKAAENGHCWRTGCAAEVAATRSWERARRGCSTGTGGVGHHTRTWRRAPPMAFARWADIRVAHSLCASAVEGCLWTL